MNTLIAELSTTAVGELCAGGAISVGGLIGLYSLRISPEKRGLLFHGKSGRGAPVSKMSLAVFATFLLTFGGALICAGLTTGDAPKWTIPVVTCVFLGMIALGFIDAARSKDGKKPNQAPEPMPLKRHGSS